MMDPAPGPIMDRSDLADFEAGFNPVRESGNHQLVLDYCSEYLNDLKRGVKEVYGERSILALSAMIRWYSLDAFRCVHGLSAAISELRIAADEAEASGYHDALYFCYRALGHLYLYSCDQELEICFLQRALPYSWQICPVEYLSTLQALAYAWGAASKTADRAVLMCDWMLVVEPKNIETHLRRYRYLLKARRRSEAEQDAHSETASDCESYAKCVAANFALKRDHQAVNAARRGRKLAKELDDVGWKEEFSKVLTRLSKAGE